MGQEEKVISKLIKDDKQMITACFDEYYFIIPEGVIKPVPKNAGRFQTGDLLPIKGKTYEYPASFNIVDLHFKLVAKVRDGRLFDIVEISKFQYDNIPAVNMMGFGIGLTCDKDLENFKNEFSTFSLTERDKLAAFANQWFNIVQYRKVGYM